MYSKKYIYKNNILNENIKKKMFTQKQATFNSSIAAPMLFLSVNQIIYYICTLLNLLLSKVDSDEILTCYSQGVINNLTLIYMT